MIKNDFKMVLEVLANFDLKHQLLPSISYKTAYFGMIDNTKRIIYISSELSESERIATILHECRHAEGYIHPKKEISETATERFVQRIMNFLYN